MSPQTVQVEGIEDGMVLARDAVTETGNVLLAVGTELVGRHRDLLAKRGIVSVLVEDITVYVPKAVEAEEVVAAAAESVAPDLTSESAQVVLDRLERVFADVRDDERMTKLYELVCQRADRLTL